jgi:hypothetical protein
MHNVHVQCVQKLPKEFMHKGGEVKRGFGGGGGVGPLLFIFTTSFTHILHYTVKNR